MVHEYSLSLQHDLNAAIAKPTPFTSHSLDGFAQLGIIRSLGSISNR